MKAILATNERTETILAITLRVEAARSQLARGRLPDPLGV